MFVPRRGTNVNRHLLDTKGLTLVPLPLGSRPAPRLAEDFPGVTIGATSGATNTEKNGIENQTVKCQVCWVSPIVWNHRDAGAYFKSSLSPRPFFVTIC